MTLRLLSPLLAVALSLVICLSLVSCSSYKFPKRTLKRFKPG